MGAAGADHSAPDPSKHRSAVASISSDRMKGVVSDEPNCVPWPTARNHAAVLAPWLDMDRTPNGGDPVSFLLAMAPDTSLRRSALRQLDYYGDTL